jgi:ubiquinone/menaquinone biosynthesis C-methylase UbiE
MPQDMRSKYNDNPDGQPRQLLVGTQSRADLHLMESTFPASPNLQPDAYGVVLATVYDGLASLYSGGAIGTCKHWGVAHIPADESALFVGAGAAAECLEPVRRGVRCHILDSSPAMLRRARRRLHRSKHEGHVQFHLGDARVLPTHETYDAVVAHFFLNTFCQQSMPRVLASLLTYLRPGGLLVLADFAPVPQRTDAASVGCFWQSLYNDLPMHLFSRWTGSDVHPVHDLPAVACSMGATLVAQRTFRLAGIGPAWFGSWVLSK